MFLTETRAVRLPTPPQMNNRGNYIVSLGNVCRWLAAHAESLGVDIFPGFAASQILFDEDGSVRGVATGDMGIGKDGERKASFEPGIELHARQVLFAEGCRGSLSGQLMNRFGPARRRRPPRPTASASRSCGKPTRRVTVRAASSTPAGWPMDRDTYGGSFLYHLEDNLISVGFVIGLDYRNPYLSPFQEFQRFKTHPAIRKHLEGGKRVAYGARAVNEGGFQSIPRLSFPGGLLIGCAAGFLNVPKIKGSHTAMKSGMTAAEAVFDWLTDGGAPGGEVRDYSERLRATWLWDELYRVRNIRPSFRAGFWAGFSYSAIDTVLLRGRAPWTFHHKPDHEALKPKGACAPIAYPAPDNEISFDRNSSVFLSGTNHEEDQPVHLTLRDAGVPVSVNLKDYDAPEQRYCPAGVYEIVEDDSGPPAADQRAELRSLQDMRHQGSDAEHRLGRARRRRGSQLPEHVGASRPSGLRAPDRTRVSCAWNATGYDNGDERLFADVLPTPVGRVQGAARAAGRVAARFLRGRRRARSGTRGTGVRARPSGPGVRRRGARKRGRGGCLGRACLPLRRLPLGSFGDRGPGRRRRVGLSSRRPRLRPGERGAAAPGPFRPCLRRAISGSARHRPHPGGGRRG